MIFDDQFLREHPTFRLSYALEEVAAEYRAAFLSRWGLDKKSPPDDVSEDDWSELVKLHRLARKFSEGASSLLRPRKVRQEDLSLPDWLQREAEQFARAIPETLNLLKQTFPNEDPNDWEVVLEPHLPSDPRIRRLFLEICLEIEAHKRFAMPLEQTAGRMLRLLRVMVREPSEFVRVYLSRVAECYIRDMQTELAVMARAVADLALENEIEDREVLDLVGSRMGGYVDLERRLAAAVAKGVVQQSGFRAGKNLRHAGNAAAHGSVDEWEKLPAAYDADAILDDLATVLRDIESWRR